MDLILFCRISRNVTDLLHTESTKNAPSNLQNVNLQCRVPVVPPAEAALLLKFDTHIFFDLLEAHVR
jgi:hypothetical protein